MNITKQNQVFTDIEKKLVVIIGESERGKGHIGVRE